MRTAAILASCLVVFGCAGGEQEDILAWMGEQARGMRGAVRPLPEIKPFAVVAYGAQTADNPFRAGRMELEKRAGGGGIRPDLDRRREPLEAFPLESLSMVGVLMQGPVSHALVQADKSLYQVKVGNYMGQNFGVVTRITESEVTLRELVEDINGDWVERTSSLLLQERQEAGK